MIANPATPHDLRGLHADRPDADTVKAGTTYWSVDTGANAVSDGTDWVAYTPPGF